MLQVVRGSCALSPAVPPPCQVPRAAFFDCAAPHPSSPGRVILTVKSAHALRDKAFFGKSDPYW